jgi:hypothetical protein
VKKIWAVASVAILCLGIAYVLTRPPLERGTEYAFRRRATTGLQESISVKGKDVFIVYTKDSDQGQRRSLFNYEGDDEVLVEGVLHPLVLKTPECDGCASPQEYQEFRLLRWRRL